MARDDSGRIEPVVIKDFGGFGDGKWQKHLTFTKWGDNPAKFDIRPWSPDMSNYGRGITLTDSELYDLFGLIEDMYEMSDEDGSDNAESDEVTAELDDDDEEDEDARV